MPAAFDWLKIMAWGNLCFCAPVVGVIPFSMAAPGMGHKQWLAGALYLVAFVGIPIAVLMRLKIGFYLGLMVSVPLLVFFPIGTVLGFLTCKAFFDSREAFGIR